MELEAVIDLGKATQVGLRVMRSADGKEQTTISLFMHARACPSLPAVVTLSSFRLPPIR